MNETLCRTELGCVLHSSSSQNAGLRRMWTVLALFGVAVHR